MSCPDSTVRFSRTSDEEAQIVVNGKCIGDIYAYDDILRPGRRCYVLHLLC